MKTKIVIIDTDAIFQTHYDACMPIEKISKIVNKKITSIKRGIVKYQGYWYPVLNGERQVHHSYQFRSGAEQVLRTL